MTIRLSSTFLVVTVCYGMFNDVSSIPTTVEVPTGSGSQVALLLAGRDGPTFAALAGADSRGRGTGTRMGPAGCAVHLR